MVKFIRKTSEALGVADVSVKTSEALGVADVSVKTSEAVPRSGRFLASAKHEAELKQAKRSA